MVPTVRLQLLYTLTLPARVNPDNLCAQPLIQPQQLGREIIYTILLHATLTFFITTSVVPAHASNIDDKYSVSGNTVYAGSDNELINSSSSDPAVLRIAVAANFKHTLEQLLTAFAHKSRAQPQPRIKISSGATGLLFSQINNGAPFDLFFSADQLRPALLLQKNLAVPTSLRTYAIGKITWVTKNKLSPELAAACREKMPIDLHRTALKELLANTQRLVIANPRTAPYGLASQAFLNKLQPALAETEPAKIVYARNIAHAQQLFDKTDADSVILSMSQALRIKTSAINYQYCAIPAEYHGSLAQSVVQLRGVQPADHPMHTTSKKTYHRALELLQFIQSDIGTAIIERNGYETSDVAL